MKNKKKAQLRYFKQQDGREGYAINILVDGEWIQESWFRLYPRKDGDETDYVHWEILSRLSNLQNLGYEIDLMF